MAAIRERLSRVLPGAGAALDRNIVGSVLNLMPSSRLIFHEWDRHGTCSGLPANAYFETVRKARAVVKVPADFLELDKPIMVTPDEVAQAFVKANPGLSRGSIAVACDSKRPKYAFVSARIFLFTNAPS